jgi:hypothetical protein
VFRTIADRARGPVGHDHGRSEEAPRDVKGLKRNNFSRIIQANPNATRLRTFIESKTCRRHDQKVAGGAVRDEHNHRNKRPPSFCAPEAAPEAGEGETRSRCLLPPLQGGVSFSQETRRSALLHTWLLSGRASGTPNRKPLLTLCHSDSTLSSLGPNRVW